MHDVGDVVGHLPERALERHEGADGDLALGREIGADREHHEVKQQHGDGDRALDHARQERRRRDLPSRLVVAHREPAEHAALQAERLDDRVRRDVLLHHAEQCGFIELLFVIRLHRLGCQDPRADQRDRKYQQRYCGEHQFRNNIRIMPAINSKNGRAALLAKPLIEPSNAARSTENRDKISPRLVRAK